jgi:hypothetical protein
VNQAHQEKGLNQISQQKYNFNGSNYYLTFEREHKFNPCNKRLMKFPRSLLVWDPDTSPSTSSKKQKNKKNIIVVSLRIDLTRISLIFTPSKLRNPIMFILERERERESYSFNVNFVNQKLPPLPATCSVGDDNMPNSKNHRAYEQRYLHGPDIPSSDGAGNTEHVRSFQTNKH